MIKMFEEEKFIAERSAAEADFIEGVLDGVEPSDDLKALLVLLLTAAWRSGADFAAVRIAEILDGDAD
jgi:hypothetical protein